MVTRWTRIKRTVLKWIFKKSREAYKNTCKLDMRCPNCREWFSITGMDHAPEYHCPEPEFGSMVTCGKCTHTSYWNLAAAPVPLLCDENGTPLQDNNDGENRCSVVR